MLNEAEIRNEQYVQFRPRYTSFGFFQFHHTLTSLFYPFRKKKCIHVTLHLFLPSFFFHPLCTFARKSINEIGSIKKRRVILLDTVTCNSFFFSFSFNSILKRFSRILVELEVRSSRSSLCDAILGRYKVLK